MPDDNMPISVLATPVDPNVKVPGAVTRAAAAADAFYAQKPPAETPPVDPPAAPAVEPPAPPAAPEPPAAPPPPPAPPAPPADPDDPTWKQRYHAMEGRFKQATNTISGMQDQMREMGDEIIRMQDFVKNSGRATISPQGQPAPKLITDQDRETYGDQLLETVQRAAVEAITPQINELAQENSNLKRQVNEQRQARVHSALDQYVPNWREINRSPQFKRWLSLTDLLAGDARGRLLNAAFKAADAPRVVAFFQGFVQDEAATGSTEFAPAPPPNAQPLAPPAPRQPAMALAALAAPGRAKPASADTPVSVDKPVFTRAQISNFYAHVRRGTYAGREAEKQQFEAAIFAAQNEGRVRN